MPLLPSAVTGTEPKPKPRFFFKTETDRNRGFLGYVHGFWLINIHLRAA